MKIRRVNIKAFGKFKNFQLSLEPGLNVIYGPNESGKTTLYNFIRSCICGLSEGELVRYQPWDGSELDGELCLMYEGGEKILNCSTSNQLLEKGLADSLIFLSDEEDVTVQRVQDSIIARLKNNVQRIEEAQLMKDLLERIPAYFEKLLSEKKRFEEELHRLELEIERFQQTRQELFLKHEEISKMKHRLSVLEKEQAGLKAQLVRLNESFKQRLEMIQQSLNRELERVESSIEKEMLLPRLDEEKYRQLQEEKSRLDELEEALKEHKEKLKEISNLLQKTLNERNELLETLKTEDLETFKLKMKNLQLSYKLLETNFKQLQEFESKYEHHWKSFEGLSEDFFERLEQEASSALNQEEQQLQEKLRSFQEQNAQLKIKIKRFRVVGIFLLLASVVSAIFGFTLSGWWFILSGGLGFSSIFTILNAYRLDKTLAENEENMVRCQLELRAIEKKKVSILQRLLSSFGAKGTTELKERYERYKRWLREKDKFEQLKKDLEKESKDLLKELQHYGAVEITDVPSVILRLEEMVSQIDEKNMKIMQLKESLEKIKADISALEQDLQSKTYKFNRLLSDFGLTSFDEVETARERLRRIENLNLQRESIERLKKCVEEVNLSCLKRQYVDLSDMMEEKAKLEELLRNVQEESDKLRSNLEMLEKSIDEGVLIEKMKSTLKQYSLVQGEVLILNRKLEKLQSLSHFLNSELERLTGSYVKNFANLFTGMFKKFSKMAEDVVVDKDLSIRISAKNELQSVKGTLSRATLDQLMLCYKLALYKIIEPAESLPLIVDNFLIRFDEERLKSAADVLKECSKERQIILMTSDRKLIDLLKAEPIAVLHT
ncbi:MAG: AAA family ATPase [Pseudothermotoga sp.]|nr:AAA family ATPase [Pseudothermotoga sp.]